MAGERGGGVGVAEVELPRGIALAWGIAADPQRGPKRELSIERIVDAAIEIADADGLAAALDDLVAPAAAAGMTAHVSVDGVTGAPDRAVRLVWRVAQEAVRNAQRHSRGSLLDVLVERRDVARDEREGVERQDHGGGAVGAAVMAEVVSARRMQHQGALAPVGGANDVAHRHPVACALRGRLRGRLVIAEASARDH